MIKKGFKPMRIDFKDAKEVSVSNMNGGKGIIKSNMVFLPHGKIMYATIPPHSFIGEHKHETSDDINYVLKGHGKAICDNQEELLSPGICHICLKGSSHAIMNDSDEEMILLTIVSEIK